MSRVELDERLMTLVLDEARASLDSASLVVTSVLPLPAPTRMRGPSVRLEVEDPVTRSRYAARVEPYGHHVLSTSLDIPEGGLRARDLGPFLVREAAAHREREDALLATGATLDAGAVRGDGPPFPSNEEVARVLAVRELDSIAPLLEGELVGVLRRPIELLSALRAPGLPYGPYDLLVNVLLLAEPALTDYFEAGYGVLDDLLSGAPLEWSLRRLAAATGEVS